MSSHRGNGEKNQETVAVAIDKDKGSQAALKWAVDHLLGKGKNVTLIHVKLKNSFPCTLSFSLCIPYYVIKDSKI